MLPIDYTILKPFLRFFRCWLFKWR